MSTSSHRSRNSSSVRFPSILPTPFSLPSAIRPFSIISIIYPSILLTESSFHPGSIVFLLFSLTALATILYLPHHIMFLVGRAWFYIHGDSALEVAKETAQTLLQHAASTTRIGATETARAVGRYVAEEVASGKVEL